jgi:AraC-like DNA-binding protein
MTARANSLIERDRGPASDPGPGWWSMPERDLRVLMTALGGLGHDVEALLAAANLRDRNLDDPDGRVPCEALGVIVSRAQQTRFIPNLALEAARLVPIGAYPLLDYLVLTADTVAAGVGQLARYFVLIGSPVTFQVHDRGDPIRVEMPGSPAPFSVEFVASLMLLHFREETDDRFAAAGVSFTHAPDDVPAFERILRCPVEPKAAWNGIRVSRDAWRLPLRRRDPVLRQLLQAQADDVLARLPARVGLALEVQRALTSRVGGGDTRMTALAPQFAMSSRTLQRRLAEQGVSYRDLLEDARKEAAGRHIGEAVLSVAEVAFLVGYSEPAAFHRAFKRWYGTTPQLFRKASARRGGPSRT